MDFSGNPMYEPSFEFYDQSLLDNVRTGADPESREFFRLLAVCHTVMPEEKSGKVIPFPTTAGVQNGS